MNEPIAPNTSLLRALGMLERSALRKVAMDSGFDVLTDFSLWIEAASSHAPLQAWLALQSAGAVLIGLSMVNVARVISAADPAAISSSIEQVAPLQMLRQRQPGSRW
jgi:hypothetical protein